MSDEPKPVLHLIVGINGAGKTTFFERQLKPYRDRRFGGLPFANADEIQRARGEASDPQLSYEAARTAANHRAAKLTP